MNYLKYIFVFLFVLFANGLFANNVKIENVRYYNAPNIIKFEISWENSWYLDADSINAPNNWDAVWVFIKTQKCTPAHSPWSHVKVSTDTAQHSTLSPSTLKLKVDPVTDGMGVFVRRADFGSGTIASTTVTLKLDNSYTYDFNLDRFQVMGIEMVAVLEGGVEVGGSGVNGFSRNKKQGTDNANLPFEITSESAITAGALGKSGEANNNPAVPANFPKGFNRFYIMKYEITQEQYAGFLNLLTYTQQKTRTKNEPNGLKGTPAFGTSNNAIQKRNGIQIKTKGDSTTAPKTPAVYGCNLNSIFDNAPQTDKDTLNQSSDGQNVACNYLKWTDVLAYLDWAALRPMTELEFEKAARGPNIAVKNEYAWGTVNQTQASTNNQDLIYEGESTEVPTNTGNGLSVYNRSSGPLRVGFAAKGSTNRIQAGASYWGVMELSGNVWEQAYSVGWKVDGELISPTYTGSRGDGEISSAGEAIQLGWSLEPKTRVVRGGSFLKGIKFCETSDRGEVINNYNEDKRYEDTGGRGVRQF